MRNSIMMPCDSLYYEDSAQIFIYMKSTILILTILSFLLIGCGDSSDGDNALSEEAQQH